MSIISPYRDKILYCGVVVASPSGATLSPGVMFHNTASNIICQVLFGKRYDYDDDFIKVVVQCFKENSKIANGLWAMVSSYRESHSKGTGAKHFSALQCVEPLYSLT